MKIITTNSIDPTLWDNFVERHPLGTIYHHSLWQIANEPEIQDFDRIIEQACHSKKYNNPNA